MNFGPKPLAQQALAAAGTRQQVKGPGAGQSSLKVRSIIIQWDPGNAGTIYIADSTVDGTHCIKLDTNLRVITFELPGASRVDESIDFSTIWFDGSNTGDKINILYLESTG